MKKKRISLTNINKSLFVAKQLHLQCEEKDKMVFSEKEFNVLTKIFPFMENISFEELLEKSDEWMSGEKIVLTHLKILHILKDFFVTHFVPYDKLNFIDNKSLDDKCIGSTCRVFEALLNEQKVATKIYNNTFSILINNLEEGNEPLYKYLENNKFVQIKDNRLIVKGIMPNELYQLFKEKENKEKIKGLEKRIFEIFYNYLSGGIEEGLNIFLVQQILGSPKFYGYSLTPDNQIIVIMGKIEGNDDKLAIDLFSDRNLELSIKTIKDFIKKMNVLHNAGYTFDGDSGQMLIDKNEEIGFIDILLTRLIDGKLQDGNNQINPRKSYWYKSNIIELFSQLAAKESVCNGSEDDIIDNLLQAVENNQ